MSEELTVRPCQSGDLPAVCRITEQAFVHVSVDAHIERRYGLLAGTNWVDRKCAAITAEIEANPEGCFVALLDATVVGYLTTSLDAQAGVGRIINLAVDPDYHGRGLGKRLLCEAFAYFRRHNVPFYRIETTTDNEVGQALYPRCGFNEITRQIIYFMSADEAAEWTLCELHERQDTL